MATNYTRPGFNNNNVSAGFSTFIGPENDTDAYGLLHSFNLIGGFQEMPSLQDRNEILVYDNGIGTHTGFSAGIDGYSTGKRRVGMLVYVMETKKIYQLLPKGYFGNDGDGTFTQFNALPEWERARLLHPTAANIFNDTFIPPPQGGPAYVLVPITGTDDDCWVELEFGDNIYTSNLANSIAMTEDVGGMPSGTAVSDLTDVKTYDQLFDTILFPTSYPTAGQPSTSLTDNVSSLQTIGATIDMILNTTANLGNISLNGVSQGQYAGNVTAASINGESGPYTLGVGPQGNAIDNQPNNNFVVQIGSNSWTLTTTFDNGPMPLDSTGADYPSLQYSSGTKTNNSSFEGVYPYFLGNGGNAFDQAGLRSFSTGTSVTSTNSIIQADQTYAEVNGSLHHRISISNAHIAGRTIEVWVFNTASNAYAEATANWVTSAETRTIETQPVQYTTLTKSGSSGGSNLYRIKFV
jgi:hypothetical protein|tara:strand:+ start:1168 stop:2562 length:1395 start_codon:yes stop_codon:yes gene_type:complete